MPFEIAVATGLPASQCRGTSVRSTSRSRGNRDRHDLSASHLLTHKSIAVLYDGMHVPAASVKHPPNRARRDAAATRRADAFASTTTNVARSSCRSRERRSAIARTTRSRSTTSRAKRRSRRACSITTSRRSATSTSPASARSPTSSSSAARTVPTNLPPIERVRAGLDAYLDHITPALARVRLAHARRHRLGSRGRRGDRGRAHAALRSLPRAARRSSRCSRATPRFETAVRGWIGFVEHATIDWCANPRLTRERASRSARRRSCSRS